MLIRELNNFEHNVLWSVEKYDDPNMLRIFFKKKLIRNLNQYDSDSGMPQIKFLAM